MKELFYIKGDPTNPEGVKEALLEKYPDTIITYFDSFDDEKCLYYVNESNNIVETHHESHLGEILKRFGTEIFPQKKQEFEEKIMYQAVYKLQGNNADNLTNRLYNTIEEAMSSFDDVVGYREVKIKVLK